MRPAQRWGFLPAAAAVADDELQSGLATKSRATSRYVDWGCYQRLIVPGMIRHRLHSRELAYFPPHRHFGGSPFQKQIAIRTPLRPKTLTRKPGTFC